jgi:hypothetical protein
MMLVQLAAVARRTGYPVVEVEGWKTRGRPGDMGRIETVTCHHTGNGNAPGNYPSLRVVRDGRPGLAGPLAHLGIGLDGTIYVIAAGKCNHAGRSKEDEYTNPHAIGIEAEAVGTPGADGDWPPKQVEAYVRLCRALIEEFRLNVHDVLGHKETAAPAGRKSDPSFAMGAFRNKVADCDLSKPPRELAEMDPQEWTRLERLLDERIETVVTRILTKDPLVVNRVSKAAAAADPNAKPSKASITWALGNIEGDQDDDRDAQRAEAKSNRPPA